MSTRAFCDGCGTELVAGGICLVSVATASADHQQTCERYEMCERCLDLARTAFNPTTWPRGGLMLKLLAKRHRPER